MEKTKRVKIVTGLKCNIQCVFCYYRDNLKAPNREFNEIRRDLLYARRHGIEEIDFSGGEPTVHQELPQLIAEAKKVGMKKICIISNGWRLADLPYLRSLKAAGLDEILFSLHGPTAEIHDALTATPGSFDRITRAMEHAVNQRIAIRTNTVVNRLNYQHLTDLSHFISRHQPVQVNFIAINDWCFAKNLVEKLMLSYPEMSAPLKEACDLLGTRVPEVNVRYIPFCFMQGYERFVCNHRQAQYDHYEWVPHVRARLEEGTGLARYLAIIGYGFFIAGCWKRLLSRRPADLLDDCVVEGLRRWFYQKHADCRNCRYRELCDGVERAYACEYGLDELGASSGERIADPVQFRRKAL
jgi:molybdenum cofactor biosynthesis enzyme MoaA